MQDLHIPQVYMAVIFLTQHYLLVPVLQLCPEYFQLNKWAGLLGISMPLHMPFQLMESSF